MTRSSLACLAAAASLALAAPAAALTFAPNPVPVNHFGGVVVGQLELVDVVTGVPSGGVVLYGAVSPTATTIVLRGSVSVGSSGLLYLGIREILSGSFVEFDGLGWIAGADEEITSAIEGIPGTAGFLIGGTVDAGEAFDLVFMSYDGGLAADGTLEFIASLVIAPEEVGAALLVPEPGVALALGAAAIALAAALSRGRRAGT
jgi:hypothetical protein